MAKFERVNPKVEIPKFTPPGHLILAIGAYCWGVGVSSQDAIRQMKANAPSEGSKYELHVIPYESEQDLPFVSEMGSYHRHSKDSHCPHCR